MLKVSASFKTNRSHWHIMESLGDSIILLILRDVLPEIMGDHSSLAFLKVLEDHAKGAGFLGEIAKYYNLQRWCIYEPRNIKEWANLCEAWIGAVFLSDSLWVDHFYECTEIVKWFQEICMIRYRAVFPYITKRWLFFENHVSINDKNDFKIVEHKQIWYPEASCFEQGRISLEDNQKRYVGYFATAHSKVFNAHVTEFSSKKEHAEILASRVLRTQVSELKSPMKNQSNENPKISKRVFPFSAQRSNSVGTTDVFSTYRRKCFDAILSSLSAENAQQFPKNLLSLSQTYQSWLDSLPPDDSSNLKTRAMLSWNLVSLFLMENPDKISHIFKQKLDSTVRLILH